MVFRAVMFKRNKCCYVLLFFAMVLWLGSCQRNKEEATDKAAAVPAVMNTTFSPTDSFLTEAASIGVILKPGVLVYADTALSSAILDTLVLAELVRVRGVRGWLQVESAAPQRGWMKDADLVLVRDAKHLAILNPRFFAAGGPCAGMEVYFDILFDYLGFGSGGVNFKRAPQALQADLVLQIMERVAPRLPAADTMRAPLAIGDALPVGTEVLIPYAKSEVYRRRKQYDLALAEMRNVRARMPEQVMFFGPSKSEAALQMGELYTEKGDTAQALAQYHFVITQCPDVYRVGSEWNDWADQAAVREITELLVHDPARLEQEARQIMSTSAIPAVKLLAYAALVKSLARRGLREAMIDTALVAVQRYPDEQRTYYQTDLNLANVVTSKVFNVLEEQARVDLFKKFAGQLIALFPHHAIGAAASYRLALLADETDGSLSEVRTLYEKVLTDYEPFEFYDNEKPLAAATYDAQVRFDKLSQVRIRMAEIVSPETELRQSFMPLYEVKAKAQRGARLKAFYTEKYFNQNPQQAPRFMKVELADSTVGWMRLNQFKLTKETPVSKSD